MPIKIPESQHEGLASLLTLEEDGWNNLVEVLKKEPATLPLSAYITSASSKLTRIEKSDRIIFVLISFFSLREKFSGPLAQLLGDISSAAERTGKADLSPGKNLNEWSRFNERLTKLFNDKASIEIVAKAQDIQYEEEHIFTEARIISDLRPVFRKDIELQPDAFLVTHALRISYEDTDGSKEIYVALDKKDLLRLQNTVARALSKETNLREIAKKLGISCLGETGGN